LIRPYENKVEKSMNEHIEKLRKHLIYPSWNVCDRILLDKSRDILCQAEHEMVGSTTLSVDRPWIPYAILAGKSIEEVNAQRKQRGERFVFYKYFDIKEECRLIVSLDKVDSVTREVAEPKILRALSPENDDIMSENIWKNKYYIGPFHEVVYIR
jgi:hypothetical protein